MEAVLSAGAREHPRGSMCLLHIIPSSLPLTAVTPVVASMQACKPRGTTRLVLVPFCLASCKSSCGNHITHKISCEMEGGRGEGNWEICGGPMAEWDPVNKSQ